MDRAGTRPAAVGVRDPQPEAPRRPAGRRVPLEWWLAIAGGLLLAVALTWPTLRHPWTTIPGDLGDPTLQAWQVAWAGHALRTNPLAMWHSNAFYPAPYSFAYSDMLLGYAPAGLFGSGPQAAVFRYNLLFVFAFAAAFIGGYALLRQLGAARIGAAVGAVAWAYAPWRLAHNGHLNVLSTGGIALCLAMLARGHGWTLRADRPAGPHRPAWAFAGWVVAAWQISLGFGIGLPLVYFLLATFLVVAGWVVWSWGRHGRSPYGRRLLAADLGGGLLFAAVCLLLGQVYLKVLELNPQARRDLAWTRMFSPPLRGYFVSPAESWLWGEKFAAARSQLSWPAEMALLPGLTLIVLATMGLAYSSFRARHRALLALGVLGSGALGLGSHFLHDGQPGYLTLSRVLPGWEALRTPGRLMVWISLLLAVLAAGLLTEIAGQLAERTAAFRRPWRWAVSLVLVVPLAMVTVESVNRTEHPEVPTTPLSMSAVAGPALFLPSDGLLELNIMLWSTDGYPRIANGLAAFVPDSQAQIRQASTSFPDPNSIAALRQAGIHTVVVLPDRLAGTSWDGVADRPVDGLGITREQVGSALVYRLG